MEYVPAVARWLHFMAGVMWIGLPYYFNFVQVAALKAATADGTAAGITKHVAPRALLYFRWAAVVTWLAAGPTGRSSGCNRPSKNLEPQRRKKRPDVPGRFLW